MCAELRRQRLRQRHRTAGPLGLRLGEHQAAAEGVAGVRDQLPGFLPPYRFPRLAGNLPSAPPVQGPPTLPALSVVVGERGLPAIRSCALVDRPLAVAMLGAVSRERAAAPRVHPPSRSLSQRDLILRVDQHPRGSLLRRQHGHTKIHVHRGSPDLAGRTLPGLCLAPTIGYVEVPPAIEQKLRERRPFTGQDVKAAVEWPATPTTRWSRHPEYGRRLLAYAPSPWGTLKVVLQPVDPDQGTWRLRTAVVATRRERHHDRRGTR